MEYILIAEEISQQFVREPETNNFKSMFKINGKRILSPMMTPEKRLEMQKIREAAMHIEQQLNLHFKKPYTGKSGVCETKNASVGNCCETRNVSTNTEQELELPPQPLTVVGRIRQTLQLSETLIYDNSRNAIMKFIKPNSSRETSLNHVVHEEFPNSPYQQAAVMKPAPENAVETADPLSKGIITDAQSQPRPSFKPSRVDSTRQVLGVDKNQRLERSISSPVLHCKGRHPHPYRRCGSYPPKFGLNIKHTPKPGAFNAIKPSLNVPTTTKQSTTTKIQVKQQHSTSVQQEHIPNNCKPVNRTTRPRASISYSAHESSHANQAIQQVSKEGRTRISSTQRRLSYDPRATMKRAATVKKNDSGRNPVPLIESSSNCECRNSELVKCQLLEMERQQRQRFQLLISQQAEVQKRMQQEFLAQQQMLMEQMIRDIARLTFDKDAPSDQANSSPESSSISLPQSHLDLEIDEPKADV